jgi:hypothetical protein
MTEIHNKIHHKILSSLPDELIGLIIEFHPYVEPVSHFDKFKLDIKQRLIRIVDEMDDDLDEDVFESEMDDNFNYYFNTDYMEIVKEKDIDKILNNKADVLLDMLYYINDFKENHEYSEIKIIFEKADIINKFRYCFAYDHRPNHHDYEYYKSNNNKDEYWWAI